MKWFRRYITLPLLIALAFLAFLTFFNDNSLMHDAEYLRQERQLRQQIAQLEDTLLHYRQLNAKLDSDPAELEKIVREHYHMQRTGEDVYIFH